MEVVVSKNNEELGQKAALKGADEIRKVIENIGEANIIVAMVASQFELLKYLIQEDVDWTIEQIMRSLAKICSVSDLR